MERVIFFYGKIIDAKPFKAVVVTIPGSPRSLGSLSTPTTSWALRARGG